MAPETERTAKKHNHPFNEWLDQEPSGHIICGGSLKRALNVLFSARFASKIPFSGILSDLSWSHVAFCECFFFKFPVKLGASDGRKTQGEHERAWGRSNFNRGRRPWRGSLRPRPPTCQKSIWTS